MVCLLADWYSRPGCDSIRRPMDPRGASGTRRSTRPKCEAVERLARLRDHRLLGTRGVRRNPRVPSSLPLLSTEDSEVLLADLVGGASRDESPSLAGVAAAVLYRYHKDEPTVRFLLNELCVIGVES